jgi:endonuclease/exonuclease/phosphatase family metal-dependent hydrolase
MANLFLLFGKKGKTTSFVMRKFFTFYFIYYLTLVAPCQGVVKTDLDIPFSQESHSHFLIDFFSDLSFHLMRSYWLAQEYLSRCYLPLIQGEYGQKDHLVSEVVWRAATHLWALPLLIISVPLLVIGNALFLSARMYSQLDYQTYQSDKKPTVPTSKISLFHLNACMMQGQLPLLFGGMTPATWRVKELCDQIKSLSPDVVMLSEVNGCIAPRIIDHLKEEYSYFYYRIGANYHFKMSFNPFGHDSNLFIAMKGDPLAEPSFISFMQQGPGKQLLFNRGYFRLDVGSFVLYFTHLHPANSPIDQTIRRTQILETELSISKEYKPVILMGDLNIDYLHYRDEYEEAITLLGLKPIGVIPSHDQKTYTKSFDLQREGKPLQELYEFDDYILSTHEFNAEGRIVPMNKEPPNKGYSQNSLSDHDGLFLEVSLGSH